MKSALSEWNPFFYKAFSGFSSIIPFWEPIADQFTQDWPTPEDYSRLALERSEVDLQFIMQEAHMSYEKTIMQQRQVPMRLCHWRDFFNNLTWLNFPKIKWAILKRYLKVECQPNNSRTSLQNSLAHFDECGIVICHSDPIYENLIKQFEWRQFFWEKPHLTQQCVPFIIGHGLLEKCLSPYIGITGKAMFLAVETSFFSLDTEEQLRIVDEKIAVTITSDEFPGDPKALQPFPFLGWPGWHPDNRQVIFYDNTAYFRPKRKLSNLNEQEEVPF